MPVGRLGVAARRLGRQPSYRLQCQRPEHSGLPPLMPPSEDESGLIDHKPCRAGCSVCSLVRIGCSVKSARSAYRNGQVSFLQTRLPRGDGVFDVRRDRPSGYLDAYPSQLAGSGPGPAGTAEPFMLERATGGRGSLMTRLSSKLAAVASPDAGHSQQCSGQES
jgi:hypothetical protein